MWRSQSKTVSRHEVQRHHKTTETGWIYCSIDRSGCVKLKNTFIIVWVIIQSNINICCERGFPRNLAKNHTGMRESGVMNTRCLLITATMQLFGKTGSITQLVSFKMCQNHHQLQRYVSPIWPENLKEVIFVEVLQQNLWQLTNSSHTQHFNAKRLVISE